MLELRDHLESAQDTRESILVSLFDSPDEALELIVPDRLFLPPSVFTHVLIDSSVVFSLPSLSSVFPFLQDVCPTDDPIWHSWRGRGLEDYL